MTGISPVLTKLWYFWGNHFAISEKDYLANYVTGAYHRETIRSNLNQSFEKMVYDATISWTMIHHLDNSENVGPKSISGGEVWRKRKKKPATKSTRNPTLPRNGRKRGVCRGSRRDPNCPR